MRRTFFFLGPARSGSKWLASFLDTATPLVAQHEHMLNHDIGAAEGPLKRTSFDYAQLADDEAARKELLTAARAQRDALDSDYAEVNVYLETSLRLLDEIFPSAPRVFLHRNPKDVVRSLLSRGWYDTPDDPRHRRIATRDWDSSGQFARVCHYVADTDRRLFDACAHRISFETASRDLAYLSERLGALGIDVDPNEASRAHDQVVNATSGPRFPAPDGWTPKQRHLYREICGDIAERMGYAADLWREQHDPRPAPPSPPPEKGCDPAVIFDGELPPVSRWRLSGFDAARESGGGVAVRPAAAVASNRHLTLGGAAWKDRDPHNASAGWPHRPQTYLSGHVSATIAGGGLITVWLLAFAEDGTLIQKISLGGLGSNRRVAPFACLPPPNAARFDIAIYSAAKTAPSGFTLERARLAAIPLPPGYGADANA